METRISAALGLPSPDSVSYPSLFEFPTLFSTFDSLLAGNRASDDRNHFQYPPLPFSSLSLSTDEKIFTPNSLKPPSKNCPKIQTLMKNLTVLERAVVGAAGGAMAGAFTYVCLLPIDTVKTKLQTKGASEIYKGTFDAVVQTFKSTGIMGFYRGISAVIVGSAASSAVYFGTCEFGKSILSKLDYPSLLIPPTAGAMGNIMSSAIMVPKELITQRMQVGANGRSWEILIQILKKEGVMGLYAGYFATLLRNLPAGVLSYSSYEYLKAAVLNRTNSNNLEPFQSVCCGALAGAISATLTTPLDVVKTRLMTQVHREAALRGGVSATMKLILQEEGWIGLTRGMGPRLLHSAGFAAIGFFAFETAKLAILHHYLRQKEALELASAST